MPEGLIEQWLLQDGSAVNTGDVVAMVRIEEALHRLVAPTRGRLNIGLKANSMVQPDMGIGTIVRQVNE